MVYAIRYHSPFQLYVYNGSLWSIPVTFGQLLLQHPICVYLLTSRIKNINRPLRIVMYLCGSVLPLSYERTPPIGHIRVRVVLQAH